MCATSSSIGSLAMLRGAFMLACPSVLRGHDSYPWARPALERRTPAHGDHSGRSPVQFIDTHVDDGCQIQGFDDTSAGDGECLHPERGELVVRQTPGFIAKQVTTELVECG